MYRKFYIIYYNKNQHFFNKEFKEFLKNKDVFIIYNSSRFFKNINIIEVSNKLLKIMLRKKLYIDLKQK